jgi:hypothetical protein
MLWHGPRAVLQYGATRHGASGRVNLPNVQRTREGEAAKKLLLVPRRKAGWAQRGGGQAEAAKGGQQAERPAGLDGLAA